MGSAHTDYHPLSNTLWLGQEASSPYQNDQSLAPGSRYDVDSTDGNWPVFSYTKAHRLHDIKSLCDACDMIDIARLLEGGASSILQDSWVDITQTARKCRFCSLIAQSTRGVSGSQYRKGFRDTMHGRDASDDAGPVHLGLRKGKLNVWVDHPVSWRQPGDEESGAWNLGIFDISIRNAVDTTVTEEKMDLSISEGSNVISATLMPPRKVLSYLAEELRRIINFPACERCTAVGAHMSHDGIQWLPKDILLALPDRVLEILDMRNTESISLRLLETRGIKTEYYIAFSHRWGGNSTLKTTKSTLSQRFRGFCLENLPRTFRDAVLVAKALGIRYLWIDSLCIIQDDQKDWLQQSAKMGSIYMNSTLTIAAHSAGQCNEGFLWRSQVSSMLRISPKRGGPEFLVSIPDIDDQVLQSRFVESEISRRAWILQELTLSPRVLHFVENRLFWECEHRPPEISGSKLETTAAIFRDGFGDTGVHTMWLKLIEQYSNYQMTKSRDKLVALAGIVDVWQNTIERPEDKQYHCGVFQEDIARSLLWYAPGVVERHLERAPSWSWASIDGKLHFLSLELEVTPKKLIQVPHFQHYDYLSACEEEGRRWTFGSMTNAVCLGRCAPPKVSQPGCRLTIQAPVIRITSRISIEKSKRIQNTPEEAPRWMVIMLKEGYPRTTYAWCIPDEGLFPDQKKALNNDRVTLSFLAVSGREIRGELVGAWCVIISPEDASLGIYRRVGLSYVRDIESILPAMAAPETITLV